MTAKLIDGSLDVAIALTEGLLAGIAKGHDAYKMIGTYVVSPLCKLLLVDWLHPSPLSFFAGIILCLFLDGLTRSYFFLLPSHPKQAGRSLWVRLHSMRTENRFGMERLVSPGSGAVVISFLMSWPRRKDGFKKVVLLDRMLAATTTTTKPPPLNSRCSTHLKTCGTLSTMGHPMLSFGKSSPPRYVLLLPTQRKKRVVV